ncbi:hypothetical protein IV38_GL000348 [Lactobacillus selangorensis]|uniref:Glycerol-3-phosphate acyltransferase n=1 Tax=Lactobacillus selangorensis TaxID=81857 RepID=A0A0R2FLN6_9LACO|nr:glycerol-3-phosphate 1-O-acyltransferase PlsY [Lactobacillus selangorensis]KRN29464.1 hypothetical protein IV38_GL000348 [Lactobacillus selangorensis]KRN34007.1 hypothetical protein IV40_GL000320 [Lactobacillus selangorensis]
MKIILVLILAYLIGSIPSGVWIGQLFYHKDIRQYGSHNTGTTNAFRVLGRPAGIIVLIMDMFKGTLAAALPLFFGLPQHWLILLAGVVAVFGHTHSIFIHFQGGKAVATSVGMVLVYNPAFFGIAWLCFMSTLLLSSMVSVASTVSMVLLDIISLFFHDWLLTATALLITVVIFYRHKDNFKRIKDGTENMVPFGLGYYLRKKKQKKD